MSILEEMADKLATKTLDAEEKLGDDGIVAKVADAIGNSSPTMQEAYLTAVRFRRGDRRAHALLDGLLEAKPKRTPPPPVSDGPNDDNLPIPHPDKGAE